MATKKTEILSIQGVKYLNNYLNSLCTHSRFVPSYLESEIEEGAPTTVWMDEKRGKFPNRLATYFTKQFHVKLTAKEVEHIGNLFHRYSIKYDGTLVATKRVALSWKAGDFADESSCYYQSRKIAKKIMKDVGIYAYVFHTTEGKAIGRCLAYSGPIKVNGEIGEVIFNAYGLALETAALTLTQNGVFKEINLNVDEDNSILYINGDKGLLLQIDSSSPITDVDLPDGPKTQGCRNCGNFFIPKNSRQMVCNSASCRS